MTTSMGTFARETSPSTMACAATARPEQTL
jgi:hypothetical protein